MFRSAGLVCKYSGRPLSFDSDLLAVHLTGCGKNNKICGNFWELIVCLFAVLMVPNNLSGATVETGMVRRMASTWRVILYVLSNI